MKHKFLSVALLLTLASNSYAQYFPSNAGVRIQPFQVTAEVVNPYYEPIVCTGQVFGQTAAGPVFNAFFGEQFMPAGSSRVAFVVTNAFNPFLGGWANINCRFVRW